MVLIAGGTICPFSNVTTASARTCTTTPRSASWTPRAKPEQKKKTARWSHTRPLLSDGQCVAAGIDAVFLAPSGKSQNSITRLPDLDGHGFFVKPNNAREEHTATLLFNGMALAGSWIFLHRETQSYTPTSRMCERSPVNLKDSRAAHTAICCAHRGRCLLAGGTGLNLC